MEDILSNVWIVGIITSLVSGLIVFYATRRILSGDIDKAYHQSLYEAKMEVLYAIRPSISEKNLPNNEIIESLIKASMMKYNISKNDYYTVEELADTLIKEVMDSSFISAKEKGMYCENLLNIKKPKESPSILERSDQKSEYGSPVRSKLSLAVSLTMATFAIIFTLMISILISTIGTIGNISGIFEIIFNLAVPTLVIIAVFSTFLSLVNAIFSDKKNHKEEFLQGESDFEKTEDG